MSNNLFYVGEIIKQSCEIVDTIKTEDNELLYVVKFIFADEFGKKLRKGSYKDISVIPKEEVEICRIIATTFIEFKKKEFSNYKAVKNASVNESMLEVYKLHKVDGYEYKQIKNVLNQAVLDSFWRNNLLTLTTIRKKCSNDLTKFECIHKIWEQKQKQKNVDTQASYNKL